MNYLRDGLQNSNSQAPTPEKSRKCTLPTPQAKEPTDKASLVFGVVMFGVETIGSEDHNGKCKLRTSRPKGPTE